MRGIYTAGVLDVFMERGLHFDGVIGVSAGALHGLFLCVRQKGRSIRYYKKYREDWRFMSFKSLLRTGDIVGEKFCYHDIPERLDPFDYRSFREIRHGFLCCMHEFEDRRSGIYSDHGHAEPDRRHESFRLHALCFQNRRL